MSNAPHAVFQSYVYVAGDRGEFVSTQHMVTLGCGDATLSQLLRAVSSLERAGLLYTNEHITPTEAHIQETVQQFKASPDYQAFTAAQGGRTIRDNLIGIWPTHLGQSFAKVCLED